MISDIPLLPCLFSLLSDVDECALLDDACKGGMQCINHFGGYLCLPKSAVIYISKDDEQIPLPDPVAPVPAVPPSQPQHPRVFPGNSRLSHPTQSIRCATGFSADEQNLCRGKMSPPPTPPPTTTTTLFNYRMKTKYNQSAFKN